MLNKKTLEKLSTRPRGIGAAPFLAAGTVLAGLAALPFSLTAALAILAVGAAVASLAYGKRRSRQTIPVLYDLQGDDAARFADVGRACEALAGAEGVWRVEDTPGKLQQPALRVEVTRHSPPGVNTNVETWRLNLGNLRIFFMPDAVLLQEGETYRAISYASLDASFAPEYHVEEGEATSDAEVVGHTWRYVKEDGKPDRRFSSNPSLTEVMYGLLEITGPNLKARLRVSNRNAAMRFARTLTAKPGNPPKADPVNHGVNGSGAHNGSRNGDHDGGGKPRTAEEEMRVELAYGILGLQTGSSKAQVTTAYRKLAKLHHPDLLQDLEPEGRQLAESRMRMINDAYTELKRQVS